MKNSGFEIDEQLYEHHRFVADRGQTSLRIDKYLCDHLENTSRNRIQAAADAGTLGWFRHLLLQTVR